MKGGIAAAPSGAALASGSRLAACLAAICGVHCALAPVFAAAVPALALSEAVERVGWAATVAISAVMLVLAPTVRNPSVVVTFVGGAALWGASLAGWLLPLPEPLTSVGGGAVVGTAMLRSAHLCHTAACTVCRDRDPR